MAVCAYFSVIKWIVVTLDKSVGHNDSKPTCQVFNYTTKKLCFTHFFKTLFKQVAIKKC